MAAKKKPASPCSPAIWKKFKPADKALWRTLYRDFQGYLKIDSIKDLKLTPAQRKILAHDHACLGVWAVRDRDKGRARRAAK